MTEPTGRARWRDLTAPVRRAGRSLPPVARREAELVTLRETLQSLRREARALRRRGARAESWQPPAEDDAVRLVVDSRMLDRDWYLSQVDLGETSLASCARHYVREGAAAGLSPHPAFLSAFYVEQIRTRAGYGSHPAIQAAPLLHYLTVGARRKLAPHPAFDARAYVTAHPEAAEEEYGPLAYFLRTGVGTAIPVGLHDWSPTPRGRPRNRDEFLRDVERAAVVLRDSRGHAHLERDREDFDLAAEAALKESLLAQDLGPQPPLVTVVLPTKDRADVVSAAVDSVFAQTYPHWQLVVVDDGSSDDTAGALARYLEDPRVRYVRHEQPRGVAAARNSALQVAEGEYVAYLDSDNTWREDFLQVMVAFLRTRGHRVAYAMSRLVEEGGEHRVLYRGMPFVKDALRERNFIDCIVLVHERSLLDVTGGFDETLRSKVDWDLFLRLADVCEFGFVPVIATEYDAWETRGDRITTEEPYSLGQVIRQRALVDWSAVRSGLTERDPDLVSVIIAASGSAEMTISAAQRAQATARSRTEIVVVDSKVSHTEATRLAMELDEQFRLRRLNQPVSVEVAHNVGVRESRGGTLVFLPEHAWTGEGWDEPLLQALEEHSAAQPLVLASGGAVWSAGLHYLPSGRGVMVHRGMAGDAPEVRGTRAVDAATSICLAARADLFVEVEGFDPRFMDHHTGGELSLRLAAASGQPAACVGDSTIALRENALGALHPRNIGNLDDNLRFEKGTWQGSPATLERRLSADGYALAGVRIGGDSDPGTPLVVHDREPRPLRWAIKIGSPEVTSREAWGDWHFAQSLRASLERLGHEVTIDCRKEWYRSSTHLDDVALVLRGLHEYRVNPLHTNVSWVISHPELVTARELVDYDLVFGGSARWCSRVNRRLPHPAELLLQCTDPERFRPVDPDPHRKHHLLVVANARGAQPPKSRHSVETALAAGLLPEVYGERWGDLIPPEAWQGTHVPNQELPAVYTAADVVLNDHWDPMREEGFVSNRIFDLAACNARAISDHLPEIADVFGDVVLTYRSPEELRQAVAVHTHETEEQRRAREELGETVRREHTFDARARQLSERVLAVRGQPADRAVR